MKTTKYLKTVCAMAVFASASFAFGADANATSENTNVETKTVKKMTAEEKEYFNLYGMFVAQQSGAKELKFTPEELDVFFAGMKAFLSGSPFPENTQVIGPKMQEYLNARAMQAAQEAVAKSHAQAEGFWKEIKANDKIQKSESGLAYEIIEAGDAKLPTVESTVSVKYTGKLIDGTVFDSTDKKGGEAVSFPLANVIKGFSEGLQKIGKGGKIRLYIPSELGYGAQQVGIIPPGSTLIFDVEMIDIK